MDSYEPFVSLGVALGMGLIIGMEREQSSNHDEKSGRSPTGGARTFPMFALTGAAAALVGREVGAWFIAVPLAAVLVFVGLGYRDDLVKGRDRGITSETAFVLTYLLGAVALSQGVFDSSAQRLVTVASIGIAATALLSMKNPLHGFVRKVSSEDIYATVKFAIATVIVLPHLPDRSYGPLQALNPFNIGLMVVLIAGVSFVGYVAVRALGPGRGLGLTGLVGGLVSSTAVSLSMSARAKREPQVRDACVLALILACTVMPARLIVVLALVNPAFIGSVAFPLGAMTLGGLIVAGVLYLKSRKAAPVASEEAGVKNPFELSSALKFGAIFALVKLGSTAANKYLGQQAMYVTGVVAGATDVDAISLSVADLAKGGLAMPVAATTVLIATASNTVVKMVIAFVLGGSAFGRRVALGLGATLAAGALGLLFVWL